MQSITIEQRQEKVTYPQLSLAVYREIAAHLQQVIGIKTELISQLPQAFDYHQSQVEGLWIQYPANLSPNDQQRLEEILNYYAQVYGAHQRSNPQ